MSAEPVRVLLHALACLPVIGVLSACGVDPGLGSTAPASVGPASAPLVATRRFTCLGMLAQPYASERITGGLTVTDEPIDVAFALAGSAVPLVVAASPSLDPAFDGGYWKASSGLDAWSVGTTDRGTYTLLLPPRPIGSMFNAVATTDFTMGAGRYQDELLCSAN